MEENEKGCACGDGGCDCSGGCQSSCIFPRCHKCGEGYLLPFSYKEDVFEKWKCSVCAFVIEKR